MNPLNAKCPTCGAPGVRGRKRIVRHFIGGIERLGMCSAGSKSGKSNSRQRVNKRKGAKTIIADLLKVVEELRAIVDIAGVGMTSGAGLPSPERVSAAFKDAGRTQDTARAFLARKPAKRMAAKKPATRGKPWVQSVLEKAAEQCPDAPCGFGPDRTITFFRDDTGKAPLFEVTLLPGGRLRVFSPVEKFAVIPEDRATVELMPFRDDGDPPFWVPMVDHARAGGNANEASNRLAGYPEDGTLRTVKTISGREKQERAWMRTLRNKGWKQMRGGQLWTTDKRGLKRHTKNGLTLSEACSLEGLP